MEKMRYFPAEESLIITILEDRSGVGRGLSSNNGSRKEGRKEEGPLLHPFTANNFQLTLFSCYFSLEEFLYSKFA